MRINGELGVSFTDAKEYVISEIMKDFDLNRKDAMRIFAESIVRNCVIDELWGEIKFLLGRDEDKWKEEQA